MSNAEKQEETNDPRMERAIADGWTPREEWEGDPAQWVDFQEFNVRGELMGRIKEQSSILNQNKRQMEDMQKAIGDLVSMNDKMAEREYTKIMKNLRKAKAEAIEIGDGEKVAAIEEDIDNLKEQRQKHEKAPPNVSKQPNQQDNPEVTAWLAKKENQWFNTDRAMRDAATGIAQAILKDDQNLSPGVVLERMTSEMKELMPHKFKTNPISGGGDQDGGKPAKGRTRGRKLSDLSEDEQAAAKRFARIGVMSIDDYIKKLDELGE